MDSNTSIFIFIYIYIALIPRTMRYYVQTQSHGEVTFLGLKMKSSQVKRFLTLSQLRFVLGGRLFLADVLVWMLL